MKKTLLLLFIFLSCQSAQADIVFLKNGQAVEGKVTPVRGVFIRVDPYSGTPFKEFLIEDVARIEPSSPGDAASLAPKNVYKPASQSSSYILTSPPKRGMYSNLPLAVRNTFVQVWLILILSALLLERIIRRLRGTALKRKFAAGPTLKELERELEDLETEPSPEREGRRWEEKREHPRVARSFPISLILDKVHFISATVEDVSLGGIYAICDDTGLLRLGDKCRLQCSLLADRLNNGICGMVEVVRIKSDNGLGLKFAGLDQDKISLLMKG